MKRILLALCALLFPSIAVAEIVNWGDYQDTNQSEYLYFPTSAVSGASSALTSATVMCYENGGTTEITTGLTVLPTFDGKTGINAVAVDFSDANFEAGKTYSMWLISGTVDSVVYTNKMLGVFSLVRSTPANFPLLVIDSNGRIQIQSGTSTGQISATSGVPNVNLVQMNGSTTIDGKTPQESVALLLAAMAGNITLSSTTPTIASIDGGVSRIVATPDADGNRTNVLNVTNPN